LGGKGDLEHMARGKRRPRGKARVRSGHSARFKRPGVEVGSGWKRRAGIMRMEPPRRYRFGRRQTLGGASGELGGVRV
jgi:hypothetical protein